MQDDEAEKALANILGLTAEDFYNGVYLHQEAIRELVSGDPSTRSRMIDKLLGLYRLNELIDALPIKTIKRKIKTISDHLNQLREEEERTKLSSTEARERVKKYKEELAKEVKIEEVDLQPLINSFKEIMSNAEEIASKMEIKIKIEPPELNINDVKDKIAKLRPIIDDLSNRRLERDKNLSNQLLHFNALKKKYEETPEKFSKLEEKDINEISTMLNEIDREIRELNKK